MGMPSTFTDRILIFSPTIRWLFSLLVLELSELVVSAELPAAGTRSFLCWATTEPVWYPLLLWNIIVEMWVLQKENLVRTPGWITLFHCT